MTGKALADPSNNSPAKLTKAVTLNGVLRHLDALQSIADTHGDRAAGRPGYQASVNYVVSQLNAAGYAPSVQAFDFPYVEDNSRLDRVSMLQRGTCGFNVKALNAQAAGASAAILFNEGQPGRAAASELIVLTPGATVRVKVDFTEETRRAWNVFAETCDGNANNVVMSGAHLDSVQDGPGINDNGSRTRSCCT